MRHLALLVLVVLAGCLGPTGGQQTTTTTTTAAETTTVDAAATLTPADVDSGDKSDPATDQLGWENGYWYDENVSVTTDDGLNDAEREAAISRAMARIEYLRQLEFNRSIPVEVITRAEYRNRTQGNESEAHSRWNNQVWEGLFIVGEDTDVSKTLEATLGTSVQGYYSPSKDRIVLVSDAPTPTIGRRTLAHELVHALQDQQFGINQSANTQDTQLAHSGLIEGDATLVERRYIRRCGAEWSCLPAPQGGGSSPQEGFNRAVLLTIYQPYATGDAFVKALGARGGWSAVNAAYRQYPASSEQVIHPEKYPDEKPVNVTVADRSTDEWRRFDVDPEADTVGEASIFAMLVTNNVAAGGMDYESEPSAGWAGDALVPYHDGDRYGYVWKTVWDTREDAKQFHEAYRELLDVYGATERGSNVYVIPDSSPFGDAFRVRRDGKTVTIVNAPTVAELGEVHR